MTTLVRCVQCGARETWSVRGICRPCQRLNREGEETAQSAAALERERVAVAWVERLSRAPGPVSRPVARRTVRVDGVEYEVVWDGTGGAHGE